MKTIYLSGSLVGRSKKKVKKEHAKVHDLLAKAGFLVFDPATVEEHSLGTKFKKTNTIKQMARYVAVEKAAIKQSDALLVITGDNPTEGTFLEVGFAKYHCKIPVVLVSRLRYRNKLVNWGNIEATAVVPNLKKAVAKLHRLLA